MLVFSAHARTHNVCLTEPPPGDMSMRHVTGKGARVPGPNPNASYRLRYVPAAQSSDREGASFAITGAHLHKTWAAYGRCVQGGAPVWDPDFVSEKRREEKRERERELRSSGGGGSL